MLTDFDYEYNGKIFLVFIRPNKYYPTLESMYQVYLGLDNKTLINSSETSDYPIIKKSVKQILMVKKLNFVELTYITYDKKDIFY